MTQEYGINIGGVLGRAVSENYKAMILVEHGYGQVYYPGGFNAMAGSVPGTVFRFTSKKPPIVFVRSAGLSRIHYVNKKGDEYEVRYFCYLDDVYFYVFNYADDNFEKPMYGIEVYNDAGRPVYNSNMETIEIVGHFTKSGSVGKWFTDISNKELAINVVGGVLRMDYSPYPNLHYRYAANMEGITGGKVVFGQREIHRHPGSGSTPSSHYWKSTGSTRDIYCLVIDVTKIERKKHPRK